MNKRVWNVFLMIALTLVALVGCDEGVDFEALEYEAVTIEENGLTFPRPSAWVVGDVDWEWVVEEGGTLRAGVRTIDPATLGVFPPDQTGDLLDADLADIEEGLFADAVEVDEADDMELGWAPSRTFVVEIAEERWERHTLAQLLINGNMIVDFYTVAATEDGLEELEPVHENMTEGSTIIFDLLVGDVDTSGWETYTDQELGFQFMYPVDWSVEILNLDEEGLGDTLERSLIVFPEAWRDEILDYRDLDAEADAIVEPLLVESIYGDLDDREEVYEIGDETNIFDLDFDWDLALEEDEDLFPESTRLQYVFFDLMEGTVDQDDDDDLDDEFLEDEDAVGRWVVFVDRLTNFPDRRAGNENIADMIPQIASTFEWIE